MNAALPMSAALDRALLDPAAADNPYPVYAVLREAAPLHWSEAFFGGAWLLTRHADVEAALRDPRLSAHRTAGWIKPCGPGASGEVAQLRQQLSQALLFLDAPDHTRLRRVLQAAFRPAALQRWAGCIKQQAEELLDALPRHQDARGDIDFMHAFAQRLPSHVICEMMGIPRGMRSDFLAWSDDIAPFIGNPQPDRELARRAQAALAAMTKAFRALLAERGRTAGEDVIGELLATENEGAFRTDEELLVQCAMLLFAGQETTRNLLGNGVHALLRHPDQWRRLCTDPSLLPGAVRELLRFDSPVQYTARRVAQTLELHGRRLRRGELVLLLIGSANHDPARYTYPEVLDIERQEGTHLSFGTGAHVCLGAALTHLEAGIALRALLECYPDLCPGLAEPCWLHNPVYRSLERLPLRLEPCRNLSSSSER